jgi:hypothetical protein
LINDQHPMPNEKCRFTWMNNVNPARMSIRCRSGSRCTYSRCEIESDKSKSGLDRLHNFSKPPALKKLTAPSQKSLTQIGTFFLSSISRVKDYDYGPKQNWHSAGGCASFRPWQKNAE